LARHGEGTRIEKGTRLRGGIQLRVCFYFELLSAEDIDIGGVTCEQRITASDSLTTLAAGDSHMERIGGKTK
jgi:hypothetical protein